jgi:hypothetical protein
MEELRPDLDEIRRELRPPRRGISTGSGIVLAAVILVTGYWGGKYIQDELEARRIQEALTEFGRALGVIGRAPTPQIEHQTQQRPQTRSLDPTAGANEWRPQAKQANTLPQAIQLQQEQRSVLEQQRRQAAQKTQEQAEATRKRLEQIQAQRKAEHEAWHSIECRFWWERQGWPAHKARELTACKPYVTMPR